MTKKQKRIIQCPFCDSNRLYFRRGLVSDVLISLLVPVRSYSCGSCSRSFRRYGNYFTSKQALIHIFGALAILAFINPHLLLPESWLLQEEQIETVPVEETRTDLVEAEPENELPLLSMAIANATNSSVEVENGTIAIVATNSTGNATLSNLAQNNSTQSNATTKTILAFNGTDVSNATTVTEKNDETAQEPEDKKHGLQEGKLKSIYFKEVESKTRISLDLGGSPLSYTSFFLKDPNRLVVDIQGKWDYFGPTVLKPENPIFSRFRIGIYDDKIRMVMDLKGQTPAPVITKTGNGLDIDVK